MLGMLIGLLSGMLMSIQGVFNAEVTKQAGVWVAAGFVQLTAFVICVAAWFVTGKEGSISGIVQVKPWYMLLGGVIGAAVSVGNFFIMAVSLVHLSHIPSLLRSISWDLRRLRCLLSLHN